MGLEVQGDPSKMTDPTQKAMLSQGLTLHAEGKSATDPMAADMQMSVGIAGQTLDFGMMAQGDKAWVEYQGKWYAVDQKNSKSLSDQAKTGAAPTEQLKSLGLDPSAWGTSYEMVGTEDMAGTQVYHVKATADPAKLAEDLTKAMNDPEPAGQAGRPEHGQAARAGSGAEQEAGRGAQEEPQERHRRLLDRRRRHADAQGGVLRRSGHQGSGGHGRRRRHDHEDEHDDGGLRSSRSR